MVITGGPARHVHGAIVLRILAILREWLLTPPHGGSLTLKEAVLFMQRLAHLLAAGVLRGQTAVTFERVFLQLLLTLCSPSGHPQARLYPHLLSKQSLMELIVRNAQHKANGCTQLWSAMHTHRTCLHVFEALMCVPWCAAGSAAAGGF